MKRKTFIPFLFLFSIFSRSGRNGSILDFFLYLFSFFSEEKEKKRSRRRSFLPLFSLSLPLWGDICGHSDPPLPILKIP